MEKTKKIQLPIRVLLCGLGVWGKNWLDNIKANDNYELAGVVEKNAGTLRGVSVKSGLPKSQCFSEITEAIESVKPDAVAIIVSPDKHGEIVRAAMEKKVHILSEKPLAKDIEETKEFLSLHKNNPDVRFVVNQNYRGRDCISTMKKMIDDGCVGEVGYFVYSHQQTVKIPGYRLEMPSPVLDDMSIHHFDLMRYLTGQDFEEIYANENTVPWSWFQGKPMFNALITMTGGVSGAYNACWAAEGKIGSWNGNIQVFGSNGCLQLTDDGKIVLHSKHDVDKSLLGIYQPGCEIAVSAMDHTELQFTLERFKDALINDEECETDIEDNARSFVAVLAAKESIKKKTPVAIVSLNL